MASLASFPPTPQHSLAHMSTAASPPHSANHPHPHQQPPPAFGPGYGMGFDGQHPQGQVAQSFPPPYHPTQAPAYPNGPVSNPAFSRSFGDGYDASRGFRGKPQIYTAVYSGVSVYEMEVQGVACMRRRSDGWLNATQILKVAGVDKGKRTKVLEKEILTGEHEKVQGGYGKYQGTWISYMRGREFCRQYGVEDILRPLLDYDVSADGSGGQGSQETPTKEQAMAANRKRFYNTGLDGSRASSGPAGNGTFFQNISPTSSVALAAMNKAARMNSPAPRPPSAHRPGTFRQQSHQDMYPPGSQQSMMSDSSFNGEQNRDSGYATQQNGEPPRKRMRPDSSEGMQAPALPLDVSMRSTTPTEPNESFLYENVQTQELLYVNGDPIALAPLPTPSTKEQQDKMNLILDLFAEAGRVDYSQHPALTQLSGEDLNIPLDTSANNALHWAATLAKIPLLKLLIQKGASLYRGNAAGQSPLISAVLVSNCWEHTCFPELLELLGPLIEVRDLQGRTILHHIAVSSGIKGRAPSSKYYLEALLEFLVRIGTQSHASGNAQGTAATLANMQARQLNGDVSRDASQESLVQSSKGGLTLVRFLSHIVNARDKAGNTALNLVARIGNRSIIQQLLEIHADPNLPNHKGVSAKDFGVSAESAEHFAGKIASTSAPNSSFASASQATNPDREAPDAGSASAGRDQVEELGQDVISSLTSMLTSGLSSHKDLLRQRTEQIDQLNQQIKELSNLQKEDLAKLQEAHERLRIRSERQGKIANLKRSIAETRRRSSQRSKPSTPDGASTEVTPAWLDPSAQELLSYDAGEGLPVAVQRQLLSANVPSAAALRSSLHAIQTNNADLAKQAGDLKARSSELEAMYRQVVSLCTGVPEEKVEESLPALVAAVESERGGLGEHEVGRVRDFLRRVDGAAGPTAADG